MIMRSIVSTFLLLFVPACAGEIGSSEAPGESAEETRMASDHSTPSPSLEVSSVLPSRAPSGDEVELTGVLGADSVEGGCGYLQASDGTRFQVIYPDGWTLQLSPLQLTSPDDAVVARGGDKVTVRGREATDMASICQFGPIFQANEVVS